MGKTTLSGDQNMINKFAFGGQISTFRPENKPNGCPLKAANNAQTTSEQLLNTFQKVKKTSFFTSKIVKMAIQDEQDWT